MPSADTVLPISQLTVVVAPTAAVACAPRRPTMAASTYCTAVLISCSSMVGQASAQIIPNSAHPSPRKRFILMVSSTLRICAYAKTSIARAGEVCQCENCKIACFSPTTAAMYAIISRYLRI